ncbi:hypothetical protein KCU72_g17819, partial [Aureobasidium melanogenum]
MDDLVLCDYVKILGHSIGYCEPGPGAVKSAFSGTGAIKPKQLSINVTAAFMYAARIYLCSLVPGFRLDDHNVTNLVNAFSNVMEYIPAGPEGHDRSLIDINYLPWLLHLKRSSPTTMSSAPPHPPPLQTSTQGTFFANSGAYTPLTPDHDHVESPSLTSGNALARFEFEKPAGDKAGTKILMVEWEDDDQTKHIPGQWSVSWEAKRAALLDSNAVDTKREGLHRLYFLLSVAERVPATVTLTLHPDNQEQENIVWRTHPLPAIFSPELGASARQAGKKGVLHTVWAKKRLQVLKQEIHHEEQHNPEGVALSMAIQERDWIESNFGVRTKPTGLKIATTSSAGSLDLGLPSPASPRSPGRGPLL